MNYLRIVLLAAALAVFACVGAFAQDSTNPTPGPLHRISLTGTHHGELVTESYVDVAPGMWATIQNGRENALRPDAWIAICIGADNTSTEPPEDAPASVMPYLVHATAGELDLWYYLPGCDQLDAAWAIQDAAAAASQRTAKNLIRDSAEAMAFTPVGQVSISVDN